MAFTRRQPIRRNTVARTGFTALDVEPAASGSGAQIFAPRDRQPGALLLCHRRTKHSGFPNQDHQTRGHSLVDADSPSDDAIGSHQSGDDQKDHWDSPKIYSHLIFD